MDKKITDITDPSIIVPADNCKDIYFSLFNSMYDGLSVFEVCGNKIRALYLNERYFDNVGYSLEQYTPYIENVTLPFLKRTSSAFSVWRRIVSGITPTFTVR